MIKLYEVQDRNQPLLEMLLDIWEQSVRATHLFLSDAEVNAIRAYVPQALKSVEHLIADWVYGRSEWALEDAVSCA